MGYWEQIGVENMRHAERQARKSPSRRRLESLAEWVLVVTVSLILWGVQLLPLIVWIVQWLRTEV